MKFLLLFCADETSWMTMPEEQRNEAIEKIGAWYGDHARAGRIVEGRRLSGKDTAVTVRLGPAGRTEKPLVVDGPFVESKEAIGSYAVVDVADLDEAIAVAENWPAGGAIEIRRVVEE